MITVIGLGNNVNEWSVNGFEAAKAAKFCVVKTKLSKTYESILQAKIPHVTLDKLYESSKNFDTLQQKIVKQLLQYHKEHGELCYLIDGSGFDDQTVVLLQSKKKPLTILPASPKSAREAVAACSYTVYSASDALSAADLVFSKSHPLTVTEIDSALVAAELKLKLMRYFEGDTVVKLYIGGKSLTLPLFEIDRQSGYDYSATLTVSGKALTERGRYDFYDLLEIMDKLRGDGGCPWDKVQTHESIRINAVEEAYELVEAIDLKDTDKMREEAGDVLLQAVFHAAIAKDTGEFDVFDMLTELCTKLIFRHSHIFGGERAKDAAEALVTWEKNKTIEKKQDTFTDAILAIPKQFPALLRAVKVQKKARKAGLDFASTEDAQKKLFEEFTELSQAKESKELEDEGGDVLFAAVNVLRHLGVDPETALITATEKFIRRFTSVEKSVLEQGKTMTELSEKELDEFWNKAKSGEKA